MRASISAALTALALLVLGPVAPAAAQTSGGAIVTIDDLGFHDLPVTWFSDAVVVPGDTAEAAVVVRNDRAAPTTVSVTLGDVRAGDAHRFDGLMIEWGDAQARVGDLVDNVLPVLEPVVLAPGESRVVTLGYRFAAEGVTPPGGGASATFTLSFRASAAPGAGGRETLPVTGGTMPDVLGIVGVLLLGWGLLARVRRRDAQDER
jgi:LPXTG-motif cell wall-anchored protein